MPRDPIQDIYDSFQGVFPDDNNYDYFLLALQWPTSVCNTREYNCTIDVKHFSNFTVHGLWPHTSGGHSINCTNTGTPFDPTKVLYNMIIVSHFC